MPVRKKINKGITDKQSVDASLDSFSINRVFMGKIVDILIVLVTTGSLVYISLGVIVFGVTNAGRFSISNFTFSKTQCQQTDYDIM